MTSVHAFFDRLEKVVPEYTSPSRAILLSAGVTACLLAVMSVYIFELRRETNQQYLSIFERKQWILVAIATIVGAVVLQGWLTQTIYNTMLIMKNPGHAASLQWFKMYAAAFTGGFT